LNRGITFTERGRKKENKKVREWKRRSSRLQLETGL
jgi:hypothetical protein